MEAILEQRQIYLGQQFAPVVIRKWIYVKIFVLPLHSHERPFVLRCCLSPRTTLRDAVSGCGLVRIGLRAALVASCRGTEIRPTKQECFATSSHRISTQGILSFDNL